MKDLIGTTLGHYAIESLLGAGGMGEVYVAVDDRLGRTVALKVLPEGIADDPDKRARFEQEARAIAALKHPGIVTIHSIEEIDGIRFFTMELIEGQSLGEKMGTRPMLLRDILDIAIPLADAIGCAHAKGIAHRDLKPDNVLIGDDGSVTVLDFGLAKLVEPKGLGETPALATTATLTTEGKIVGTVQYMSPEQAEGKTITPASDVFSLGVIIYEMAAGERPFRGDSAIQLITSIMRDEPVPVSRINASMPPHLNRLLRRCLVKDPARRYQSAIELRNELEMLKEDLDSGELDAVPLPPPLAAAPPRVSTPSTADSMSAVPSPPSASALATAPAPAKRRGRLRSFVFGVLLTVIAVLVLELFILDDTTPITGVGTEPIRRNWIYERHTEAAGYEWDPALSPDGRLLAFIAKGDDGKFDIMLQRVGGRTSMNLTRGNGADDSSPVFSPDGEQIAFASQADGGGVFIMGATGESIRRVSDFGTLPSFSPDGRKLVISSSGFATPVARNEVSSLHIIDIETGDLRLLHAGDAIQPAWSPNGKYIAFWTLGELPDITGQRDIGVINVETGSTRLLTDDLAIDWNPVWSADGRELYFGSNRGGTMAIWSVGFDPDTGRTTGELRNVPTPTEWAGPFSISAEDGSIAYTSRSAHGRIRHIPVDPASGPPAETVIENHVLRGGFNVSHDGEWIAFQGGDLLREDIYISRLDGSNMRQLTDDLHFDRSPSFSPDDAWVLFISNRGGDYQVWGVHTDGSDLTQFTDFEERPVYNPILSPDGKTMAVSDMTGTVLFDFKEALQDGPLRDDDVALLEGDDQNGERFIGITWSPDGEHLFGSMAKGEGNPKEISLQTGEFNLKTNEFHQIDTLDENEVPLTFFSSIVYAPDGETVYIRSLGTIYKIDLETGETTVLASDVVPLPMAGLALTPDGRSLYLDEEVGESNIWISRPQE